MLSVYGAPPRCSDSVPDWRDETRGRELTTLRPAPAHVARLPPLTPRPELLPGLPPRRTCSIPASMAPGCAGSGPSPRQVQQGRLFMRNVRATKRERAAELASPGRQARLGRPTTARRARTAAQAWAANQGPTRGTHRPVQGDRLPIRRAPQQARVGGAGRRTRRWSCPNAQLNVAPSSAYVVGVDVGPATVVAASADITGRMTARVEVTKEGADDPVGREHTAVTLDTTKVEVPADRSPDRSRY